MSCRFAVAFLADEIALHCGDDGEQHAGIGQRREFARSARGKAIAAFRR
jgi:hypothetical protein